MSDNLRVRLEFKRFVNKDLINSLLSFKRSETKDVKSLELLIQKRFHLSQPFSLFIDNFVLERTEPIDILRDNDLIVIEPKFDNSLTKVENKSIFNESLFSSYFQNKPKTELLTKSESKRKHKSKHKSKEYVSSDSESNDSKIPINSINIKSENKHKILAKNKREFETKVEKSLNKSKVSDEISIKTENESNIKEEEQLEEVSSLRNITLRKAFQSANTSIKKRPQISRKTPNTSESKPKKKRHTREATEPVDRFSPIIILERQHITTKPVDKPQPIDNQIKVAVKQSARKSFPVPPKTATNNEIIKSDQKLPTKSEKKEPLTKTLDFDNCEPLDSIPSVGDIIAFKMLTLSSDGIGYEASLFNMGSVLCVNKSTQMVDILLEDVIHRNNMRAFNRSDAQTHAIHSLKINWSTVLEPKLIQRAIVSQQNT